MGKSMKSSAKWKSLSGNETALSVLQQKLDSSYLRGRKVFSIYLTGIFKGCHEFLTQLVLGCKWHHETYFFSPHLVSVALMPKRAFSLRSKDGSGQVQIYVVISTYTSEELGCFSSPFCAQINTTKRILIGPAGVMCPSFVQPL